jgi:hypothetical protein
LSTIFSKSFLWGAATSAYQIEGSHLADGAGPSIWHRFVHTPGRIENGDTGDLACDHYRQFESDVTLMRDAGLNAYRFSISWSRIFPEGTGRLNQKGLDFYQRLFLLRCNPLKRINFVDAPRSLPPQNRASTIFVIILPPAVLEEQPGFQPILLIYRLS